MAIERHECTGGAFHTIQGLLDCGHCNAVLANIPPFQEIDDNGENILVCQLCGSGFHPEELADARVEEIMERVNERVENPNCTMIGESRVMELEEKEEKYDKLKEQAKVLREALEKIHATAPSHIGHIAWVAIEATKET